MQGVLFGEKHSYRDFDLIANSIEVGIPAVKTNYVDVPCGNGALDLTEAMGEVKYGTRTLRFEFTLLDSKESKKSKIINEIHGKKLKIEIDREEDYCYLGRCHVEEFSNAKNIAKLTVLAECEPLKYKKTISMHRENIVGKKSFICVNKGVAVMPLLSLDANMKVELEGKSYELKAGKQKVLGIRFQNGHNRITVSGNGTIVFTFQEGVL